MSSQSSGLTKMAEFGQLFWRYLPELQTVSATI
jgi:hypothetical protein